MTHEYKEARKNNKWQHLYENPRHPPDAPKKSTVAAFHLITGDDYLAKHHRIGISTTLTCKLFYSQGKFYRSHNYIFPAIVMENCRAPKTRESKFNDLNPNQFTFEKLQPRLSNQSVKY